ncbi:hypothetical protein F5148DRAFT_524283 [Russula earlei]|uniref:Uncharacterized protein n=1 Tax=Russula earlei TaxID=71964 RepID=A0ACC0UHK5_9AGAM|nr:hypothetical protein F5148DRAFT_524283 [Russula earlei]
MTWKGCLNMRRENMRKRAFDICSLQIFLNQLLQVILCVLLSFDYNLFATRSPVNIRFARNLSMIRPMLGHMCGCGCQVVGVLFVLSPSGGLSSLTTPSYLDYALFATSPTPSNVPSLFATPRPRLASSALEFFSHRSLSLLSSPLGLGLPFVALLSSYTRPRVYNKRFFSPTPRNNSQRSSPWPLLSFNLPEDPRTDRLHRRRSGNVFSSLRSS